MNKREKIIKHIAELIVQYSFNAEEIGESNCYYKRVEAKGLYRTHKITQDEIIPAITRAREDFKPTPAPEPEIETTPDYSIFSMNELPFKSSDAALEYVEEFFTADQLKPDKTFYGKIIMEDNKSSPSVFMVEIVVLEKKLFSKSLKRLLVAGIQHEELLNKLEQGDLVIWGCLDATLKIPTGVVVHKLQPVLNVQTGQFNIAKKDREPS